MVCGISERFTLDTADIFNRRIRVCVLLHETCGIQGTVYDTRKGRKMISKLEKQNTWGECLEKLNEVIDAVNWLGKSETEIRPENTNTYELYLKNKHLIGKLCKFKCAGGYCYGLLTNIKRKPCQWPFEALGRAFSSCEPVKPDDDIIYHGE